MKPTLDLYVGRRVTEIRRGKLPWQWALVLEGEILIVNKSRKEVFPPGDEIIGHMFRTFSMSGLDTSCHFFADNGSKIVIGFKPTQYAIQDPKYGGEVYPQWPEELEKRGIPSHPEEDVSALPDDPEVWAQAREQLVQEKHSRQDSEAREFLEDTDEA